MKRINALYQVDHDHDGDDGRAALLWYASQAVATDSHALSAKLVSRPVNKNRDHCKTSTRRELPIEPIQYQKDLEAVSKKHPRCGMHRAGVGLPSKPQGVVPPAPLTTASVRYWSDFSRVYYHPRSAVQIAEFELESGLQPFEGYGLGRELFRDLNREHDLLDRDFRLFAEECDCLQGIQLLTSSDDGWAGFAGEYVAELRDEYGKAGICTWALERTDRVVRVSFPLSLSPAFSYFAFSQFRVFAFPHFRIFAFPHFRIFASSRFRIFAFSHFYISTFLHFCISAFCISAFPHFRIFMFILLYFHKPLPGLPVYIDANRVCCQDKQVTRTVALAMTLTNVAAHSSLYIPLRNPTPLTLLPGLGHLTLDSTSVWHCSALLSAAIETSTLPTRLRRSGRGGIGRLDELAAFLNVNGGQNIATLAMSVGDGGSVEPKSSTLTELNFSWGNDGKPWRRDKNEDDDKDHVFAEAHVVRGFEEREDDGGHGDKKAKDDGPGHLRRSIISRWGNPCRSAPPLFWLRCVALRCAVTPACFLRDL